MYYCFCYKPNELESTEVGVLKRLNEDINYAVMQGSYLYFDSETEKFYNSQNREVDIKDKTIQVICGVLKVEEIMQQVQKQGGILPISIEERSSIKNWNQYYEPKRKCIALKGKDIKDKNILADFYYQSKQDEIFIKTKKKDFNGCISIDEILDEKSSFRKALEYHLNDDFIMSEKVYIDEDALGPKEYRVFVRNRKVLNISRIKEFTYHKIDSSISDFADKLVNQLPATFPKNYVVDLFSYNEGIVDVVEFNAFETTARYLYNSIFSVSVDILHNDMINAVPVERRNENLGIDVQEYMNSTHSMREDSFSKDLNDIARYGSRIEGDFFIDTSNHENVDLLGLVMDIDGIELSDLNLEYIKKK
ncbi:MAG: hypothetical protein PHN72_04615 [Bacilli bacterium]|nr:hypothetical protein [Bacilli bacterium]